MECGLTLVPQEPRIPWAWRRRCGWQRWRDAPPTSPAACRDARSPCRPPPPRGCWIKEATGGVGAARRAALEILRSVRAGTPLADARDRHLAGLAERDRRLAYELSAGVLRRQRELDTALDLGRPGPRLPDGPRLGAH